VDNLFLFSAFGPQYNVLIFLAMTRAFQQYPISHRWSIVQSFAHLWVFALHRPNTTTHNCAPWPPPPSLLPTGYVVHAAPLTRGASTAPCVLLPAQSARLLMRHLRLVHMRLHPASIPQVSSLRLLGLPALTASTARSMPVAASSPAGQCCCSPSM
jgi:hypothetical protein